MKSIKGKRGAEMTVGTLVIIVLAIIVLVVLVIGFSTGTGGLWDRIKNFFGGGENVDTIVQSCKLACTSSSQYAYCTQEREVKKIDSGKIQSNKYTCKQIESLNFGLEKCTNMDCPSQTNKPQETKLSEVSESGKNTGKETKLTELNTEFEGKSTPISLSDESTRIAMENWPTERQLT